MESMPPPAWPQLTFLAVTSAPGLTVAPNFARRRGLTARPPGPLLADRPPSIVTFGPVHGAMGG